VYPCRGAFERDFFKSRGPQEVREVFQRVGVEMPDQVFQEAWQEAERRDPRGEVSIESFRAVLERSDNHHLTSSPPHDPRATHIGHTATHKH
ncbi:EF-hand domain-containing family member B, partial [Geodia barretti]